MYHFTLAHRAISIAIRIKKWTLPFVRYADQAKTKKRTAKAQSTASKKEGSREEPGLRTEEKNPDTPTSDSDAIGVDKRTASSHSLGRNTNIDQQHENIN